MEGDTEDISGGVKEDISKDGWRHGRHSEAVEGDIPTGVRRDIGDIPKEGERHYGEDSENTMRGDTGDIPEGAREDTEANGIEEDTEANGIEEDTEANGIE